MFKNMLISGVVSVAAATSLVLVAGCSGSDSGSDTDTINVGFVAPLSSSPTAFQDPGADAGEWVVGRGMMAGDAFVVSRLRTWCRGCERGGQCRVGCGECWCWCCGPPSSGYRPIAEVPQV